MRIAPALALALAAPNAAFGFAELDRAEPRVGATVAAPPSVLTLDFSEDVEHEGSSAQVRDRGGARVDRDMRIDPRLHHRMIVRLKPLAPGEYTVVWRARSHDGDDTQGRFVFTVGR